MDQIKQIKNLTDAASWGKILHNPLKCRLLWELSKSPIIKSKLAELVGVKQSTISEYVYELINLGLVEEEVGISRGRTIIHLVKIKVNAVMTEFSKLTPEGGWRDATTQE